MDNVQMLNKVRTCPACGSHAVALVSWEELPHSPEWPEHWIVDLHCGECEIMRTDIFSQSEVDLFDEWLDEEQRDLTRDCKKFERANMQEWVDKFHKCLNMDIVMPEDF